MTKQEFLALSAPEQLYAIYERLPERTAVGGGHAGMEEIFTREAVQPVQDEDELPEGFEAIFGPRPPRNSRERGQYDKDLAAYGGSIDLTKEPSYLFKCFATANVAPTIGVPMAYLYAGKKRLIFENRRTLWRDFAETWNNISQLETFARVAANPSIR